MSASFKTAFCWAREILFNEGEAQGSKLSVVHRVVVCSCLLFVVVCCLSVV